ncbi:hypothetical protein V6Z11_A07G047800 [Gossypium hirsutum]
MLMKEMGFNGSYTKGQLWGYVALDVGRTEAAGGRTAPGGCGAKQRLGFLPWFLVFRLRLALAKIWFRHWAYWAIMVLGSVM